MLLVCPTIDRLYMLPQESCFADREAKKLYINESSEHSKYTIAIYFSCVYNKGSERISNEQLRVKIIIRQWSNY